ncbi:hypothetical protein GCM10027446_33930 [Angustibacter peucedani]
MSHLTRERRGAHRPSGLGVAGAVPWLVAAVAIVAIVAWATGWWGGGSDQPTGSNTVTAGPSSSGTSSSTRTTKPSSSSTATSTPTATADRTQSVAVLNSTGRSGLAAGAADTLRGKGWTIRATGNAAGDGVTTVYYGSSSLKATAQAVADDLGAPAELTRSTLYGGSRVTVVLGTDYPG